MGRVAGVTWSRQKRKWQSDRGTGKGVQPRRGLESDCLRCTLPAPHLQRVHGPDRYDWEIQGGDLIVCVGGSKRTFFCSTSGKSASKWKFKAHSPLQKRILQDSDLWDDLGMCCSLKLLVLEQQVLDKFLNKTKTCFLCSNEKQH